MKAYLVPLLAIGLLAACTSGTKKESSQGQVRITTTTVHRRPPKPPRVETPWRHGLPQKGLAVFLKVTPGETLSQARLTADRVFDYAVGLGANSVSLSFPFFVNGVHGTRLYGTAVTLSPRLMGLVVSEANKRLLRVTLRPLMDEANLMPNDWRGSIEPANRTQWFASYRKFLQPYLAVAKVNHVATFVLGVEYNSLKNDPHWTAFVKWAKSQFPGQLSYSANWNAIGGLLPSQVASLGVDAYFDTSLSDDASVSQITAVWDQWLNRHGLGRRIVLSEVGIAAESGAYHYPFMWGDPKKPFKPLIQSRWFQAACNVFKQHRLAGIYFWRLNFSQDLRRKAADKGAFAGWPAATVVKACFRR